MAYRSLRECVDDLARTGQLVAIDVEIDPHLEAAEIQRRVYQAGGPALYFSRVKGSQFPMVSNLFGTMERARFIFRDALAHVRKLVELKVHPRAALANPFRYAGVPLSALYMLPMRTRRAEVMAYETTISALPQLKSWPDDGGAFVTLPQVYSEDPEQPGFSRSNLGMYRVQLSGGQYEANREIGLHYQIHRGIGVHHAHAIKKREPLRVNVFVGGPPAMTLAAVMPLPEGLSELSFAGALGRRRVRMFRPDAAAAIHADADFCITGEVDPARTLPEGPFGDHLGYYSLVHPFPVLSVKHVYHRKGAIWPFTVVGRPPQEDTAFGELIHELTGPVIPSVLPGVDAVHAVDAAGVHPLLLAMGSERYRPYAERVVPEELLTQANAILGQGQMSLAKYLFIAARDDAPALDIHDVAAFFEHVLERVDFERDLHFQTRTTIDTLDYSGTGLNSGSKVVVAAVGRPRRTLAERVPASLSLPSGFSDPRVCAKGVLAVRSPAFGEMDAAASSGSQSERSVSRFCDAFSGRSDLEGFALVLLVDDSEFTARSLRNWVWVAFTRSNPAVDVHGVDSFVAHKHWGCRGPLVIDARRKPHHAPPLVEDPEITARVDRLGAPGGALHGLV